MKLIVRIFKRICIISVRKPGIDFCMCFKLLKLLLRNWIGTIRCQYHKTNYMSGSRPQAEVYSRFSSGIGTQKYKKEEFKDSKIFAMGVNGRS